MNEVKLKGKLTKAPWFADKGWASCTLSVTRPGTTFSLWVPLYVPSKLAPDLKKMAITDDLEVIGELDQKKDKTFQVKVTGIKITAGAAPVARKWDEGTGITDDDIPF